MEYSEGEIIIDPDYSTESRRKDNSTLGTVAGSLVAGWYGFIAACGLASGFRYLDPAHADEFTTVRWLCWIVGITIGTALATLLTKRQTFIIGAVSSIVPLTLVGTLLYCLRDFDQTEASASVFGIALSPTALLTALCVLTILAGAGGAALGGAALKSGETYEPIEHIQPRHWLWLWIAVFAWVTMLPTASYYIWLEVISTGYVFIHPSLWFNEAWTEGWTISFGIGGIAALMYGIEMSLKSVSRYRPYGSSIMKRVGLFFLGTGIIAGPVSNILLRLAIHTLKHLPDGLSANPWWVLR